MGRRMRKTLMARPDRVAELERLLALAEELGAEHGILIKRGEAAGMSYAAVDLCINELALAVSRAAGRKR